MKSVLITGAAKRVGRGLALGFAAADWHVFAHYNTSRDEALSLAGEISATPVQADLGSEQEARGLIATCLADGNLQCVINSASVFDYDFADALDSDIWQSAQAVNLYAPVIMAEEFHTFAKANDKKSCVINMLDNKVFALNPDYFSYTVAKAGLLAATRMQAMAFAPVLRVCGIAPGITLISGDQSPENFTKTKAINPLGKGCTVDDLVGSALFIATGTYASGQVLTVDGGQAMINLPRDVAYLT
ncbi:MAG TPA: SDR family oxidoreductase [Rhodospirillales bacterium]|nr:SDR family oxidoreductase [Rhodospirillales bacterium]